MSKSKSYKSDNDPFEDLYEEEPTTEADEEEDEEKILFTPEFEIPGEPDKPGIVYTGTGPNGRLIQG